MELRSAVTLKPFDTITLPGIGTKRIGAIHQVHHDQYQIRLDEKFVESVRIDIVIGNGEHRSPERLEGPWAAEEETPEIQDSVEQIYDAPGMTNEYLLAGLEGGSMPLPSKKDSDIPTDRPSL